MTDIRRTLLWVIFSMSLFLIWDAWNKHNGQPSFFSPPAQATKPAAVGAASGSGATPAAVGGVPVPGGAAAPAAATAAVPAASAPAAAIAAERVTVTTDVVKATLDSRGGSLDRVELLQQVDPFDSAKHVVLLDQSRAAALRRADRPGAAGRRRRSAEPPHADDARARRAHAAAGAEPAAGSLRERAGRRREAGQDLHLPARRLPDRRDARGRQRVGRTGQPAPLPAARARRQCAGGRVELLLHLHRPGGLHRQRQVPQDRFQDDREAQARRQAGPPDRRRQRLGRDGAALLRVGLADRQARRAGVARVLHRQGRHQHVFGRHVRAGRRARAGREQDARCEALHRPAGREQARADRARPRAGQGLRLVHDPREAAVLAADAAAQR